jgi:hypothetical protein
VIASRFTEGRRAWTFATLPFVFLLVGVGFLTARESNARMAQIEEREARARVVQARFDEIHADFTFRGEFAVDDPTVASILVIDAETQSLAQVQHEGQSITTYCVGALEGETLRLVGELDLHDYVDASGATIYDRYTVLTGLERAPDCNHERYDFR